MWPIFRQGGDREVSSPFPNPLAYSRLAGGSFSGPAISPTPRLVSSPNAFSLHYRQMAARCAPSPSIRYLLCKRRRAPGNS